MTTAERARAMAAGTLIGYATAAVAAYATVPTAPLALVWTGVALFVLGVIAIPRARGVQ